MAKLMTRRRGRSRDSAINWLLLIRPGRNFKDLIILLILGIANPRNHPQYTQNPLEGTMKRRADLVVAARRWKSDVCAFIEEALVDPETGEHFKLYPEQREFLQRAFTLTPDGRMPYSEQCFSCGKKSGKTALAAFVVIFTAVHLAPSRVEIYLLANDLEQSTSRVFKAVAAILEASPLLRRSTAITANRITFKSTGTTITAVPNDYRGFAGANPTLNVFDESAYYVSESSHRLWAESVPSPARKISFRLSVSTAGFEGELRLCASSTIAGCSGEKRSRLTSTRTRTC
jgi:phage terminase large subunit-like protein